jgi:glutamate synthase domain-containing protein 3
VAYVYDPNGKFLVNCNLEMVALEEVVEAADVEELKTLIENQSKYTGSAIAKQILDTWQKSLKHFHKVMPVDYKRALKELAAEQMAKV